jgi:hypothetical protein
MYWARRPNGVPNYVEVLEVGTTFTDIFNAVLLEPLVFELPPNTSALALWTHGGRRLNMLAKPKAANTPKTAFIIMSEAERPTAMVKLYAPNGVNVPELTSKKRKWSKEPEQIDVPLVLVAQKKCYIIDGQLNMSPLKKATNSLNVIGWSLRTALGKEKLEVDPSGKTKGETPLPT